MTPIVTVLDWLKVATAGAIDSERRDKYSDAHLYIGRRLLRLWDAPVETIAPADIFSAEWSVDEDVK